MSAVKRYAEAITSVERNLRIENWTNRRIAVIESHTNIDARYAGRNASMRFVLMPERSPALIRTNTTSRPSTTPRASRFCAGPGETAEGKNCCSSATTTRVVTIAGILRRAGTQAKGLALPMQRFADRCEQFRPLERLGEEARLAVTQGRQAVQRLG